MTALLASLALISTLAAGPQVLSVDAARSTIRYRVNHKLHKVEATSHAIEGKALLEEGAVRAMVRVPVASFDSGDANRDEHMRQTMEAGRFPHVVLKAAGPAALPAPGTAAREVKLRGELDFHGVKRGLEVPVTLQVEPGGAVRVKARLAVSLEAHGVERPSLLLVKLDDECLVDVDLVLGREP